MMNRKIDDHKPLIQVAIARHWRAKLLKLKAEFGLNVYQLVEEALQNKYGDLL